MRKPIRMIAVLLALAVGFYIYKNFMSTGPSMKNMKVDHTLSAVELYTSFDEDEAAANIKYLNKIVEVTGELIEIKNGEDDLPYLDLKTDGFGVIRCTMESNSMEELNGLKVGASITVKGECIGYLLDVLVVKTILN
jgi:tRNA_anti-like